LQNAVVTQISHARVRTTHISGMATDIGIELGLLVDMQRRHEHGDQYHRVASNLRLHAETVLAFLCGGALGIVIYHTIGNAILLLAAALLSGLAITGLLRLRRGSPIGTPGP
jgi:uncharacterized membrane protein YoaK (UPF0700 family)